jgi:hypothetical protein
MPRDLAALETDSLDDSQSRLATAVIAERLRASRPTELRVRGRSMYPFLLPDERVLLETCPARSLRPGNVAAFERDGQVVLHRVLRVNTITGQIIEKGDNVRQEGIVAEGQILGRATAILTPRYRSLCRRRRAWLDYGIARLSAVHARICGLAQGYPRVGWLAAYGFTALLRSAAFLARPRW